MQKRHARWIAGLAVAGTAVLTGASAGASAGVPNPQEISPATCAALASDLAGTLANASKGLAATPPDLDGVTVLVAQANKLQDAFKSLDCTAVSVPAAPVAPSGSAKPSLPASPSLPSLSASSSVPSLTNVPGLGSVPGLPAMPQ